MADDVLDHHLEVFVDNMEGLERVLRSYLEDVVLGPSVWVVRKLEKGVPAQVVLYYCCGASSKYFVSPSTPVAVNDGDELFCECFTPQLVDHDNRFSREGSLLSKLQIYFDDK